MKRNSKRKKQSDIFQKQFNWIDKFLIISFLELMFIWVRKKLNMIMQLVILTKQFNSSLITMFITIVELFVLANYHIFDKQLKTIRNQFQFSIETQKFLIVLDWYIRSQINLRKQSLILIRLLIGVTIKHF